MKIKTNLIVSLILAIVVSFFIIRYMRSEESLNELLTKTELSNLNGVTLDKNELKGKVLILAYFQTWCSDCAKEQPELLKLQEKFGAENLKIMMISDEPVDLILQFKAKFQSPLDFFKSSNALKSIGIKKFPTTYLIDKEGNTKVMRVEGINWYTPETIATIEQLLAQ